VLAERYFTGHGPATLRDFVWWSGLKVADAKVALALAAPRLATEQAGSDTYWMASSSFTAGGDPAPVHLLPAFDEYLVGYQDRSAVLTAAHARRFRPYSNGMFGPTIVLGGAVLGTWSREPRKGMLRVTPKPFRRLRSDELRGLAVAAEHYGRFLKAPVVLSGP